MISNSKILDDFLDLVTYGFTNPMPDAVEGPWKITAKDVIGGEINFSTARKTTQDAYDTKLTNKSRPKIGDVLLTKDGTLGRLAIVRHEGICVNQSVAVLRPNSKILPDYLFYLLSSPEYQRKMIGDSDGSVIKHIYISRVGKMDVDIPSIDDQKKSLKHLSALDEKIELNRQTNQSLEEMAQAVFKSWFVDFEPTRAKVKAIEDGQNPIRAAMAAIAGKTVDQLDTLSAAQIKSLTTTAALFPDAFEPSELGEIPAGWHAGELNDIAQFSSDRVDVSNLSQETYVSTENMLEGKRGITSASSLPAVKTVPSFSKGHILISNIRPYFKKIWLARFQGGRSNDVLGLEAIEAGGIEYLYNLLYQDKFFDFMMTTSKGAKMPRGDKDAIMGWGCVHPKLDIRKAYSSLVRVFYEDIEARNVENRSLEQLRDVLLPKLLSGELEVVSCD